MDIELHRLISTNVPSIRLSDEIKRYNQLVQVVREVVDNNLHAQEVAVSEHLEIVRALQAKQPEEAAAAAFPQYVSSRHEETAVAMAKRNPRMSHSARTTATPATNVQRNN